MLSKKGIFSMKITELKTQKNGTFYNLFVDGEFLCSVNDELIFLHHLSVGKEIDKEELTEIIKQANLKKSYNVAIKYLGFRMRTEQEVENYLLGKEFDENTIHITLEKLKDYKFIDDAQYIKIYIKGKISEGHSRNKIKYYLIKKGLEEESVIAQLQSSYPHDLEIDYLEKQMEKVADKYSQLPYRDKVAKISQYFLQRGYQSEDIRTVSNKIISRETEFDQVFMDRLEKLGNKYIEKYKRKGLDEREVRQKTMEALYRKGYDVNVIKRCLDSVGEDD